MGGGKVVSMKQNEQLLDPQVQAIYDALSVYKGLHPDAKIDVRRRHEVSIHIRVIDPDFRGVRWATREDELWPLLRQLPYETFADITVLLLLTPEEVATSLANMEFEDPTPWPLATSEDVHSLATSGEY